MAGCPWSGQLGLDGCPLALAVILPDVAPPVEVCGAFQARGESLGGAPLVKLSGGRPALPQAPLLRSAAATRCGSAVI